ncbi:hypothetical protein MKJ01_03140 [Chryseobacterium sp. SSA4.19]|uniref:hypothetical protein n=1 Tax=Chryseobacterium sp. SSA4.19 TaxID=2919915 RepID=UPI001F4DAAB4|nr:hypothetical protein [Chryseobacterium sp. SSA4.19]MCJ8152759.1 hypothetical protein [Chryseobacterium sp. SSA4.19]
MQKSFYLIITIILFSLNSCYTYQVKKKADPAVGDQQASKKNTDAVNAASAPIKSSASASQNLNGPQPPVQIDIKEQLVPNKNVKIDVDGKSYKIIIDRWENDSLVAHPVRQPEKILKFHKNQINSEKIAEKRFSQPIADIITITVYAGIGVAIWSLLR